MFFAEKHRILECCPGSSRVVPHWRAHGYRRGGAAGDNLRNFKKTRTPICSDRSSVRVHQPERKRKVRGPLSAVSKRNLRSRFHLQDRLSMIHWLIFQHSSFTRYRERLLFAGFHIIPYAITSVLIDTETARHRQTILFIGDNSSPVERLEFVQISVKLGRGELM